MPNLTDLHAPALPILRQVLAEAGLPRAGVVLDLACGDRAKWPLYREILGGGVRLLGVDWARAPAPDMGGGPREPDGRPHAARGAQRSALICGDAHRLPLVSASADAALCVAALGMFADVRRALGELRRVLRPGAPALFVTAERRWAQLQCWPADLALRLDAALAGAALPPAHPDLTGDLAELLASAGLQVTFQRAFLLEPALPPLAAELVGSSRVDLQACKLEYSIVSPK